jgi:hypothetical protein
MDNRQISPSSMAGAGGGPSIHSGSSSGYAGMNSASAQSSSSCSYSNTLSLGASSLRVSGHVGSQVSMGEPNLAAGPSIHDSAMCDIVCTHLTPQRRWREVEVGISDVSRYISSRRKLMLIDHL